MVPSNVEERSGIDNENYVVITEDHVVDGVANFMARCILANPKAQVAFGFAASVGFIFYYLT